MKKIRLMSMFIMCGIAISTAIPQTPPTVSAPTNEQAKTTCLALEHMVVLARNDNKGDEALVLAKSYMLVKKYVTDSSLHDADVYVQYFLDHYGTRSVRAGSTVAAERGNGFVNFKNADIFKSMKNDLAHQSGVIVYDKSGVLENLHFLMDSNALEKTLKDKGAVPAENH